MALLTLFFIFFVLGLIGAALFFYLSARGVAKVAHLMGESSGAATPRAVKRSIRESRQYGRMITRAVQQCPTGPLKERLSHTIKPIDAWLANLTKLEKGLEKSYGRRNLAREMHRVNHEIEQLRRQTLNAAEAEVSYLHDLVESKRQHLRVLKELQAFQTQAELKIRKIASDLGATHAEILLIIARGDFNENRLGRLDENLQDHLAGVRDVLSAMDELGYSRTMAN